MVPSGDRVQVVVHIDQAILTESSAANDDEPHCCELDDGPALALDTARRLACDATTVGLVEGADGEPLSIGRKSRSIPPAIARALRARDGGCRFPGCDRTRFTEGHHVKHWADGGETKLGNLVTLCGFHHRLVHEGGYGLTVTDDGLFVFTSAGWPAGPENGVHCFRGNISRRVEAGYRGFEDSLSSLRAEPRSGSSNHCGNEPLPMAWRNGGLRQAIEAMQVLEQKAASGSRRQPRGDVSAEWAF